MSVTQDQSVGEPVQKLEVYVGVGDGNDETYYRLDPQASLALVSLDGRDLTQTPYDVLLHDGNSGGKPIMVAIVGEDGLGNDIAFGAFQVAQPFVDGKVLHHTITLSAITTLEVVDTGCIKFSPLDSGVAIVVAPPNDLDCDGDGTDEVPPDCNDLDPSIGPSAVELCDTTDIDEDCDGDPIEDTDADSDGVTRCVGGDCDDNDSSVGPGKPEKCDGKDNDCNGLCDDNGPWDSDDDGYTLCDTHRLEDGTCENLPGADCDDSVATTHVDATEMCDGVDNDCNGVCDDGDENDGDLDGFTWCGTIVGMCGDPLSELVDCQPDLPWAHPFATEICDGVDTNCDGSLMDSSPCYRYETADPGSACVEGVAVCDDDAGDGAFGLGACSHDPSGTSSNPADPSLCDAYAVCEAAGDPDPFSCAGLSVPPVVLAACAVPWIASPLPNLCTGGRSAPISGSPSAFTCGWWIYGGMEQDHYTIGLSSLLSPGIFSDTLDGCDGTLTIIAKRDLVPQDDIVWLGYSDDATLASQLVEVDLTPFMASTCPADTGLDCTIAIP